MRLLGSSGRRLVWGCVLAIMIWISVPHVVPAQETHTLDIRNGTVYVDGQALSPDQLPDGLNLEGITAQYRFLGIQKPVIELNGQLFAVDQGLRAVTEQEVRNQREAVVLQGGVAPTASASGAVRARSETEDREYLDAVQRSSRELYERLLRERRMEQDARQLARAIRLLPEGPQREAKTDTLRAMLDRIFDLKQENRYREIRRLERQIREIEESIQERADMRDVMIERRLQQLIDSPRDR